MILVLLKMIKSNRCHSGVLRHVAHSVRYPETESRDRDSSVFDFDCKDTHSAGNSGFWMIESSPLVNDIDTSRAASPASHENSANSSQPTASSSSVAHHQPKHARMRSNGSNKYNALPQLESQASSAGTSGPTLTPLDYRDESRGGGMRKFAWKKYAIGAAVVIGMVWLFGPRESRDGMWSGGGMSAIPAIFRSLTKRCNPQDTKMCPPYLLRRIIPSKPTQIPQKLGIARHHTHPIKSWFNLH
jgi:hypothetical protein